MTALFWAIYLTLYLNAGWWFADYHTYKLPTIYKENPTLVAKIAAGGWGILATERINRDKIAFAFTVLFWPMMIIISFFLWFLYGLCWLLWVMFWGGGVRLLGLI